MKVNELTKNITLIAMSAAILFLQEQLLSFLPNIQFTVLLIFVFSKVYKTKMTLIIVLLHVILDNLYNGSFSTFYTPFMFIGWAIIPICLNSIFKNVNKPLILGLLGILFSLIYCWLFIIPSVLITKVKFLAYIVNDVFFEILLAGSSFLTIIWLFEPLCKPLNKIININNNSEGENQ